MLKTANMTEPKKTPFLGNLTVQILFAMLLGAALGIFVHNNYDVAIAKAFSDKIKMLATIFIRLVQMIIAPLVFTTLVVGIAKLGDIKAVGRSIVEAMAMNEILQIVIFSIFFGLAAASIGDFAKPVINALDKTSHIILKMVNYVMKFAPMGVFGAIAGVFAIRDLNELLLTYAKFFGSFLVGITTLWVFLILVGIVFLKQRILTLLKHIVSPLIIAFGTTSSEAVFPKLTEELERFGVKECSLY